MSDTRERKNNPERAMIYEIRVDGHLGTQRIEWLVGTHTTDIQVSMQTDGSSLLTCRVADQAALYGLIRKVRDLGLPLISVNRV